MLYIFRHTYGWQKEADGISISQFVDGVVRKRGRRVDYGTGLGRRTVFDALNSLVEKGYILRFIPGRGYHRLGYYFLHTVRNRLIVEALEQGDLTIGQALSLCKRKEIDAKTAPNFGAVSAPSAPVNIGAKTAPTKKQERGTKERRQKKATTTPNNTSPQPKTTPDTDEHLREQHTTQRRRREGYTGQPIPLRDAIQALDLPVSR